MKKMTKIEVLWERLKSESALKGAEDFHLVRIDLASKHNLSAGIDGNGGLLLSLEVVSRPPAINLDTEALDYFRQQRTGGRWLMVLRLSKPGLQEVFGRLCQDLVDSSDLMLSEAAAINLFRERLLLWKNLFLTDHSELLEGHQIQGLMAELMFLKRLLEKNPEQSLEIVKAWTGPKDYPQDFTFSDQAYEIKSTYPASDKIRISSAEQLDFHGMLFLCVYFLQETVPGLQDAITLVELTTEIESNLATHNEALSIFRDKLLLAKYVEQEYYEKTAYQLVNILNYRVWNDFPRLYAGNVPDGLSDVTYSVPLNQIERFIVERV